PFTDAETFIHFSKNAAVDIKSFANPRTPSNPTGDLKTSEEFARMVDVVSPMALEWENTGAQLSKIYTDIVKSANAATTTDTNQQEAYNKAYNYLHPEVTETDPFDGSKTTSRTDSKDFIDYETNMGDYVDAIMQYRNAYNI